jgi:uncharacterized membrane protein (UPF0127 family)
MGLHPPYPNIPTATSGPLSGGIMAIDHRAAFLASRRPSLAYIRLGVVGRRTSFEVQFARGFLARFSGWMFRQPAQAGPGLWLAPCDAIHTLFMRFEIDVVFLDDERRVMLVDHRVRPWRMRACLGAQSVIELPAGRAMALGLAAGDQIETREHT